MTHWLGEKFGRLELSCVNERKQEVCNYNLQHLGVLYLIVECLLDDGKIVTQFLHGQKFADTESGFPYTVPYTQLRTLTVNVWTAMGRRNLQLICDC